jgi:hypothetical protein
MFTRRETGVAFLMDEEGPELREAISRSPLLQKIRSDGKSVVIDNEKFYVLEGDLLLDEDQVGIYALQRETLDRARNLGLASVVEQPLSEALVGITRGGKIVRWKQGLVLTYCVLKGTFNDQASYRLVCDNMKKATEDWQLACGVEFEHKADLDESPGTQNPGVLFTVRGIDAGGQFIAAAFFPGDPVSRRRVLIDPSYFSPTSEFDKTGVLRHELGHTLGFRHEHIRSGAPPGCPDEDVFGTINLGDYDPRSVMHYFCGGVGSRELALTELDRIGSQKVYGPPFGAFQFVDNEGGKSMESTGTSATGQSPVPWGRIQQPQVLSSSRPTTTASSIPDGAYVTAMGDSNALFRVQNGRRQPIEPTEVATMGITQNDIQEVDPLELLSLPLEDARQRAIGRNLQTYLWSDLRSGHFMQSWVWLQGTTLTVRTVTETVTWFGGYTGGVSVMLFDAGGIPIQHNQIRYRYGVDGRAFGSGVRDATESVQLPQNVADAAESILIWHYWDPKVNLVDRAFAIAKFLWELYKELEKMRRRGEPVNAGGDPF